MKKLADSRERLIINVCEMYYMENKSQQEIADFFDISRPQISRILTSAKNMGLVSIKINNPYSEEFRLEKELEQYFPGVNFIAPDTLTLSRTGAAKTIASALGDVLCDKLKDNDIIGILGGTTLAAICRHMSYIKKKNLSVVPLAGGIGPSDTVYQSNLVTKLFSEKLGCTCYQLYAPASVASKEVKQAFINEITIKEVLDIARQASMAIVGIGVISDESAKVYLPHLDDKILKELSDGGCTSVIGQVFLDSDGRLVPSSAYEKMIGISYADMKKVPHTVAVAMGRHKINAIISALRSGLIHTLITDYSTARELLDTLMQPAP